jgi:hypothetical protein
VLGLENLGRDTEADVAGLLDAAVDIDISIVDDEEEQLISIGILALMIVNL